MPVTVGSVGEVPTPARDVTIESTKAFSDILLLLFEKYPADGSVVGVPDSQSRMWRENALKRCRYIVNGRQQPAPPQLIREAVYLASDTGVPTDELMAAYALLFL